MVKELVTQLWPYHAGFMITGFILMIVGLILINKKTTRSWFRRAHMIAEILGSLFAIIGLLIAVYMLSGTLGDQTHLILGVLTLIFATGCTCIGILRRTVKYNRFKNLHRWWSIITIIMMTVTIVQGAQMIFLGG